MTEPTPPTPPPFQPQPAPGQPVAPGKVANPQRRQRIVALIALAVVLVLLGGVYLATRHNASMAKVGDCMKQTGTDSLEAAFLALTGTTIRDESATAADSVRQFARAWRR